MHCKDLCRRYGLSDDQCKNMTKKIKTNHGEQKGGGDNFRLKFLKCVFTYEINVNNVLKKDFRIYLCELFTLCAQRKENENENEIVQLG